MENYSNNNHNLTDGNWSISFPVESDDSEFFEDPVLWHYCPKVKLVRKVGEITSIDLSKTLCLDCKEEPPEYLLLTMKLGHDK